MLNKTKIVTLSTFLIIGLAASSVHAEPERAVGHIDAPPHPSKGELDNGKISLTKLVPPITKVFDYSGDFWDRSTLFGDLGGGRTWLYNKGFTLDAQLTQVYQGVTSGGAKDNGNAQYNGLLEINSTLDTAKMDWWSGGLVSATAMSTQERYDIFMNNWTEKTWVAFAVAKEVKGFLETYKKYPPRPMQTFVIDQPYTINEFRKEQDLDKK